MIKISAFIITKNEAHRIAKSINSIKNIVDEIIVVDSGSNDDTVIIAEKLGAKVIFNEWPGYVKQKSFAESLCRHDWILNIDADEELTDKLVMAPLMATAWTYDANLKTQKYVVPAGAAVEVEQYVDYLKNYYKFQLKNFL